MSYNSSNFNAGIGTLVLPYSGEVIIGASNPSIVVGPGNFTATTMSLTTAYPSSNAVTVKSGTANSYSLTYPSVVASNVLPFPQNTISYSSSGIGTFISSEFQNVFTGPTNTPIYNTQAVVTSGTTVGGKCSFPLVRNGSNIFTVINSVQASAVHISPAVSGFVATSIYAVSLSNIIVSALMNGSTMYGGAGGLEPVIPDGCVVYLQVIGV